MKTMMHKSTAALFLLLVLGAIQFSDSIPQPIPQRIDVPRGSRFLDLGAITGALQEPWVQGMLQHFLGKILGGFGGGGGGQRA